MADLPSSLVDKLFGWCISLFLAALALYWAVQLICAIWPVLVICLIVCVAAAMLVRLVRWLVRYWWGL